MRILYRQTHSSRVLSQYGIGKCYVKRLCTKQDAKSVVSKPHHHNGFEIHMIENGHQTYEIGDRSYRVAAGELLLIPPGTVHAVLESAVQMSKISITFEKAKDGPLGDVERCYFGEIDTRVAQNVAHILCQHEVSLALSSDLIELDVLEAVVLLLRRAGMKEGASVKSDGQDPRYLLAVQYVRDNIERAPRVADVARYCYIGERQLSRIFVAETGASASEYICRARCARIAELLADRSLSLAEISERMCFCNEYYFHAFFKRHAGMSPGAYRRSVLS